MAALICKAIFLPCKYLAQCLDETCKFCGDCLKPVTECLCNPEYPFSMCFFVTFLGTFIPGVLTIGIVLSQFGTVSQACSNSGLHVTTLVHVPIFVGHFLFAWYLNNQFVEVDRGRAVIGKFWQMFLYDPAVLVYILFLVFNIVWLVMTTNASAAAVAEGCCDAAPMLCQIATACVFIESLFFVIAPFMIGVSLMNECCTADEQRRDEARQRQAQIDARRGGLSGHAPVPLGMRLLAMIPIIGWFFRPTQRPQAYAQPVRSNAPPATGVQQAQVVQSRPPDAATMDRQAYQPPAPQPSAPQAYAYPADAGAGSSAPPAYSAVPPQQHVQQPGYAGASAPPPAQPQEESASALMGKLAGKAAKGLTSGAMAGASAVSNARKKPGQN
mmetsp:Transcript_23157/g.59518  ORF Transcript_23157/g.59518 Transcript_23157/m.59518 type:complete len:385 (-) Transcript_23157:186-1340(-)|eukprot:CAMPEP_0119414176 /NCGR_PEP_ID=MMETSP1335-20130426/6603_1 /TAXON_ID=259385 /ORGANISM="Chrysoculter rhomboideus, Strain RCC1486" /LENGTH=384 /DNA_ID=CAMNT_0007439035 /DNA_START=67 /DNA_END=1221 /DNA_ORIENTATION=-